MENRIQEIISNTNLDQDPSKWEFDESTTYQFLPIITNEEDQLFAVFREQDIFQNKFRLDFKDGRLAITFINQMQRYYLGFSENVKEMILTGADQQNVLRRLS